eukprot:449347_1
MAARQTESKRAETGNQASYLFDTAKTGSSSIDATIMISRYICDSPVSVCRLANIVADRSQVYTQASEKCPYCVGMLIIGHDKTGLRLYETAIARRAPSQSYIERHIDAQFGRRDILQIPCVGAPYMFSPFYAPTQVSQYSGTTGMEPFVYSGTAYYAQRWAVRAPLAVSPPSYDTDATCDTADDAFRWCGRTPSICVWLPVNLTHDRSCLWLQGMTGWKIKFGCTFGDKKKKKTDRSQVYT